MWLGVLGAASKMLIGAVALKCVLFSALSSCTLWIHLGNLSP